MRTRRGTTLAAAAAIVLAGCAPDDGSEDPTAADEATEDGAEDRAEDGAEDAPSAAGQLPDPNDDVEDGVYRGNGIVLPVPEGWTLDPGAFAQGLVAAVSEDGTQQLSAQAVDTEASGQPLDLDTLIDTARQIGETDVDEEIELAGAARAHRMTFPELPAQQEGAPAGAATVLLAEDGDGLVAEFVAGAAQADYDEELAELLVATAGFDPDSEPAAPSPPSAPAPG